MKTAHVWAGNRAGDIDFCVCDDLPTLVWMAQLAAIELHPSLSLVADVERPTVLAFDLDPGRAGRRSSSAAGSRCGCATCSADFGLECFPKTSGSKGMQVYVPLNARSPTSDTKPFANAVAQLLERQTPDLVVSKMKKVYGKGRSSSTGARTTRRRRRSPSTRCGRASARPPRPR